MSAPDPNRGYYYDPPVTDAERRSRLAALQYVLPTVDNFALRDKIIGAIDRVARELGEPIPESDPYAWHDPWEGR